MTFSNSPFGGAARSLGVPSLSGILEACLSGELISILSVPLIFTAPLTGDERKNNGDDAATFCCEALGVPGDWLC